ncbi:MAG: ABC transporter ATP-binding protein [Cellulosilyticum sp.]|nr:ABC transporter ATP-binding protein [Cellulosilyticum sp.]
MTQLELKRIGKRYADGQEVIRDFSLDIKKGEFVVLVGPSGCGKSTLLRMIAGLEEITSGELRMEDRILNFIDPQERNLSMVFQNYALYPHMNVYKNMAFGAKMHKIPKDEIDRRVKEVAEILGISHLLKNYPRALSGGQKQRVAIGSVMVLQPNMYLMDEPLSNLDAKLRNQMRIEIAKIHQRLKKTFIYVTHDQVEAMTLGTKIVVMKKGEIQQVGSPEEIYNQPKNQFVAGFMGTPAMNFIRVKIVEGKDGIVGRVMDKELLIPSNQSKELVQKGYLNKEVNLGFRPNHVTIYKKVAAMMQEMAVIKGTVLHTEELGKEMIIYTQINGKQVAVRAESDERLELGQDLTLYMDMQRVHWFDVGTGENILLKEKWQNE